MTLAQRHLQDDDRGSTLVEQLVVISLAAVVGTLVLTTTISLTRGADRHGQRVSGLTEQQVALERMTRDLRAADPVVSLVSTPCEAGRQPAATPAIAGCANSLVLELDRQGARWRITYGLSGGVLRQQTQRWTGSAWTAATAVVLARDLLNGPAPASPVFAISDTAGRPVADLATLSRVSAKLVSRSTRPGAPGPLDITAEVTVRNNLAPD